MHKILVILSLLLLSQGAGAQELNCNIQVVSRQIQGTNKQIFQTMQNELYEFMNTRIWTGHTFKTHERIECNFLITLNEQVSSDEFKGTLQIQLRRPVYHTNYNTNMLNFLDNDIHFRYVEFEPLEFNENSENSNLIDIMAYYAYIVMGLDYDSFSAMGGTPFYEKAKRIVDFSQNKREKGWKAFESRKNRYWIVENLLSEKYSPLREFIYRYHRLGLDKLESKVNDARANIAEDLKLLQKLYRIKPDPYMNLFHMVVDAKSDEIIKIFSESFMTEKGLVIAIMNEIDPENSSKYQRMTQSQNRNLGGSEIRR